MVGGHDKTPGAAHDSSTTTTTTTTTTTSTKVSWSWGRLGTVLHLTKPPRTKTTKSDPLVEQQEKTAIASEYISTTADVGTKAVVLDEESTCREVEPLEEAATFVTSTPVHNNLPPLTNPVLIPRLSPGATFPFARAWAPGLEHQAIKQEDWMSFIDNLNTISFPHPSITVLELAAIGVAFAPIEGGDGIAALMELLAKAITEVVAKVRCNKFLDEMNKQWLHPRRLNARIVSTKLMRRFMGIDKDATLIAPLTEEVLAMTAQQRCMEFMKPYISELSWDVPPPRPEMTRLAKMAMWKVGFKVRKVDRAARGSRKKAWKRRQKGKKASKREAWTERTRAKHISWLLVQNLDEFERQEKDLSEEKERKKADKAARRRFLPTGRNKSTRKNEGDPKEVKGVDGQSAWVGGKEGLGDEVMAECKT